MNSISTKVRWPLALIGSASLAALSACDNERSAEADTPVSEAEVTTDLPQTAVSDEQLQMSANVAADLAASPPPEVVPVPVPTTGGNATAGGGAGAGNGAGDNAAMANSAGQ